jgi:transposase-like protein
VIREQQTSGLSISAFCRERDVPLSSFFQWRRKLKERRREKKSTRRERPSREGGDANNPGDLNATAAKFVRVQLDAPLTAQRTGCEVVLPDGCRILVPTGCDASWLRALVEALQGAPSC